MKLPKPTRKLLFSANGKPVEIPWPKSAPEARRGYRYPLHNKDGRKACEIVVERVCKEGTVLARVDSDPHRPLYGLNGTRNEHGDYESEPERVSKDYESRLSQEGYQKTVIQGSKLRLEQREQRLAQKLERAKEKGWTRTQKTVEELMRAA